MVLGHYGILEQFKPQGTQIVGPCPLHNGSNRKQFVVHATTGNFFCFGDCKRGGAGPLEFGALRENVPITTAARLIATWFALSLPPRPGRPHQPRRTAVNTRPSHRAYLVENRESDDANEQQLPASWNKIGAAWPHKDGKGLNIVLSCVPINGRIVLREFTPEDEAMDAKRTKRNK